VVFAITMTMYSFFRAVGATFPTLDAATQVTGVALQILIVYAGYLIPPRKMHPWFSWLRWINPVQYAFESLMINEFNGLTLDCQPPYLVPSQVPGASPEYQSCALPGSTAGSTVVDGARYIEVAFGYSTKNLWRNFGIVWAFWLLFVVITAVGMEMQKPNKGGGAVTVFKRGQVPETIDKELQNPAAAAHGSDEESGEKELSTIGSERAAQADDNSDHGEKGEKGGAVQDTDIARNESVFTFQNINYRIPVKDGERKLLQDVQGFVRPGKLTALMGSSGAGKTTLLNTLAQRIRFGVVTGDFLVDGKPLPKSFQRSSGFAEQQDIHEPTSTVLEALRFSAKLRQPKEVPLQEKYDYCETIIDLLEMRHIAGAVIGVPGNGLNQEQRKRLTIGVELASKPELLMFLDEPTSGLDSAAAGNILRFMRKLADAGQAILCTIHQPSSVLFEHFDTLLLLKSGGRVVYFGDLGKDSRTLIDYLETNGAKKCPPKANPAEYMLDVIGAGNPDYKGQDWGDVWRDSEQNQAVSREIAQIVQERARNADASSQVVDDREYAMPLTTQISTVLYRSFTALWRNQDYVVGMFMLHIMTGLFNSFTFWHLGNSQIDMQSRLFSIFMTLTISPPLIQQLQPQFLKARNIFAGREQNSKIYGWPAFVIGALVSEIPYRIAAGTIYWCCWYWAILFPRGTYTSASMWLMVMSFELFYLGFGQAIASFSPNELLASLLVPIFFTFIVSFCGVVVPYAALPYFWQSWMYWLTPFKWILESMLALVTHDVPIVCDPQELASFGPPPGQTCAEYAGEFARQAGGYVVTQDGGLCGYCQYATGDEFVSSLSLVPHAAT
jgi:ATP-binding cassette subfamily G (WHITE) protein 2 (SNQ2)